MIRGKELLEKKWMHAYSEDEMTIELLYMMLNVRAEELSLPAAFSFAETEPDGAVSITVYHPRHQSQYLQFVLRVKNQGTSSILSVALHNYKSTESTFIKSLGLLCSGFPLFRKKRMEEELRFYRQVEALLEDVWNGEQEPAEQILI